MIVSSPYKGLARYTYEDAHLFAGRSEEIDKCASMIIDSDARLFLVHGYSGCGKSSFLEAGLVPRLDQLFRDRQSTLEPVHDFATLPGPEFIIRSGPFPLKSIALSVCKFASRNKYTPRALEANSEREFVEKAGDDDDLLLDTLNEVLLNLPHKNKPLFIIDQAEDIFRVPESEPSRSKYMNFLAQLTYEPIFLKVVVALRTEYKAQLDDELLSHSASHGQLGTYHLSTITDEGILQAINLPLSKGSFGVTYEVAVPEMIRHDLKGTRTNQPILSVLQVICDRLYTHWFYGGQADRISEADYRATGAASAQIQSYVEEKIIEFFLANAPKDAPIINLAEQADRWQSVLASLASFNKDGKITAHGRISAKEVERRAQAFKCKEIPQMLTWLSEKGHYVLECTQSASANSDEPCWKLIHDSVAVAMVSWQSEGRHRMEHLEDVSVRRFTRSEDFDSEFLYGHTPPPPVSFKTLNDMIWDHLIPIYAESKGFARRLGLHFQVETKFDLTNRGIGAGEAYELDYYSDFLKMDPKQNLLAVLPGSSFPQIEGHPWTTIGIPNLYCGYAVVAGRNCKLQPLKRHIRTDLRDSVYENDEISSDQELTKLREIGRALSQQDITVHAYEAESVKFLNYLLKLAGFPPRGDIKILKNEPTRFHTARDSMFKSLIDNEVDFVLGPAPSRALAQQAGFQVLADFNDIYCLAPAMPKQPDLDELQLHELWVVTGDHSKGTLLRLLSVMLYTAEVIREDPEDFVRFIYNQVQLALDDGGYPLQREFIRKTIENCYIYPPMSDYAFTYFSRSPSSYSRISKNSAPLHLYNEWSRKRAACDQLLLQLAADERVDTSPTATRYLQFAEAHYRILNFYDAQDFMHRAQIEAGLPPDRSLAEKRAQSV